MRFVPRKLFLTRGVGINKEKLNSFEMALRNAGIAHLNIVRVSSIFPPGCKIASPDEGLAALEAGEVTFVVLAEMATNEPGRRIASSIGIAIPADQKMYGYLSEHHTYGQTEKEAGDYAEDLAASMLATLLGVPFDLDKDYNERREQYRMGGHIVDSTSITQTAEGASGGVWTDGRRCGGPALMQASASSIPPAHHGAASGSIRWSTISSSPTTRGDFARPATSSPTRCWSPT